MIDTDKYEGHTPAPWVLRGNAQLMLGNSYMTEADGLLLRDAPLLLAEVKRLREIEREWKQMWSKLEDYPEICAELICFMESEQE